MTTINLQTSPLLTDAPSPVRRRLWKAGGLIALFIVASLTTNFFVRPDLAITRTMLGHDFLAFYAAGGMARAGHYHDLYSLAAIKAAEVAAGKSAGMGVGFGPWWNPPFAAWFFAPFTYLPFAQALNVWQTLGIAALIASTVLLIRMLPAPRNWRNWGLVCLLMFTANPVWAVFTHGQNAFLTLLLLCITVTFWRNRQGLAAGLVAGLLLYKPQHAAVVSLALVISLGLPALAGLAITACSLLAITMITMPGALQDYAHMLPRLLVVMQEQSAYAWDRHVTLKAFWRLLLQGDAAGTTHWLTGLLWWSSELLVFAWLAKVAWNARRDPNQTDRLISVAIAAGPLLATFCFDYDLLILAVPAVLCAADFLKQGRDRRLMWAWIVLYLFLHVSTPLARITRFVLSTPALVAIVGLTAARPRRVHTQIGLEPIPAPSARAIAA